MTTISSVHDQGQGGQSATEPRAHWMPAGAGDEGGGDADADDDFRPLTAQQAQAWRGRNPVTSPWRVLLWQVLVAFVATAAAGVASGQWSVAASVAWGGVAVVLPAAVFARALRRQLHGHHQAGAVLAGVFVWEFVKIVLTALLLLAAPRVVSGLNWLALVAGFVVTMKVYWLAMVLTQVRTSSKSNIF